MESFYQSANIEVPDTLTKPSKAFKKQTVFAVIGLFLFVAVYLGLMFWFGRLSYELFSLAYHGQGKGFLHVISALCLGFLSIFMFKSLFIFKDKTSFKQEALSPEAQPILFDFLHQLADEAKAPRPNKVYLTDAVNASVFYDLSIFNLIFPSKKNLNIGLGLINVLSIGELKAVLAHEFGHFAQRSMLLGRYVYTAQQIAVRVVNKRDALDAFLAGLSQIDFRIAWIGWILSILVWAIRSLIQTLFSVVVIAERALSREMEFQADLVAVSITGSDALINALSKLKVADEAYHAAIGTVNDLLAKKQQAPDLFALQSNYIEKIRWVFDDPKYGRSPKESELDASLRLFGDQIVNPPEMWATHPSDNDREANSKRVYIKAKIDERSGWLLFSSVDELRQSLTADIIKTAKIEGLKMISVEESIDFMNKENFNWSFLNPEYKGSYLMRYSFVNFESVEALYDVNIIAPPDQIYTKLYNDKFKSNLVKHRSLQEEIQALKAIQYETGTVEKRKLMYRGTPIKRKEIPTLINRLEGELAEIRALLMVHDQTCRRVSFNLAENLQPGLGKYLKRLSGLVHYAEHTIMNMDDALKRFMNTLQVAAAGRTNDAEMHRLIVDADELYQVIKSVFIDAETIELDPVLTSKIGGKAYQDLFEEFKFERANKAYINEWIEHVEGWFIVARKGVEKLRNAALEQLLDVELSIKTAIEQQKTLDLPIGKNIGVINYSTLMPGQARELTYKLSFWNRLMIGEGLWPSMAKFTMSASLIVGALYIGNVSSYNTVYIYNELSVPVSVKVGESNFIVLPHQYKVMDAVYNKTYQFKTSKVGGEEIETVMGKINNRASSYVYNVANSGYFIKYTVSYGYDAQVPEQYIGTPSWYETNTDHVFTEPPNESQNYEKQTVLASFGEVNPSQLITLENIKEFEPMILSHAKWDGLESQYYFHWMTLAAMLDSSLSFAYERLNEAPDNLMLARLVYDEGSETVKDSICETNRNKMAEDTTNASAYYLSTRCLEEGEVKRQRLIKGSQRWPENPWLMNAAASIYADKGEWRKALEGFEQVIIAHPQFVDMIGFDVERIRRLVDPEIEMMDLNNLIVKNVWVKYYRALEVGESSVTVQNHEQAFHFLAQGFTELALEEAELFPDQYPMLLWYIAATFDARESVVEAALNQTINDGIDMNSIWVAIGLRAKHDLEIDSFVSYLKTMINDDLNEGSLLGFIRAVKHHQLKRAKGYLVDDMNFKVKVRYKMIGGIILGDKTPKEWQKEIETLLYITEKPNLFE